MNSIEALDKMKKGGEVTHRASGTRWMLVDKKGGAGSGNGLGCVFVELIDSGSEPLVRRPGSCPLNIGIDDPREWT